jgi:uncharacterized protein YaaW (UPF0174 family)
MSYKMKGFSGFGDGTKKTKRMEKKLGKIAKKAYKNQKKEFEKSGMDSYVKFMAKGDHSKKTKRLHKRFEKIEDRLHERYDKIESPNKAMQEDAKAATKQAVKETAKPVIKKGLVKMGAKAGARMLGPVGAVLTSYEVAKLLGRASKKVIPGLKKRAAKEREGGSMYTSPKL